MPYIYNRFLYTRIKIQAMKKFILVLLATAIFACDKDNRKCGNDDSESEATITSVDGRKCLCHCGGYFIKINEETFRFMEEALPPNNLNLSPEKLPMRVELE